MKNNKEISNEITVIIPVYNGNNVLFNNAITSLKEQYYKPKEVLIIVGKGTKDHALVKSQNYDGINTRILAHDKSTSFASQMNIGVDGCNTKWFSFLEEDDEMGKIWLKNANKYINVYKEYNIFLPIIVDVDNSSSLIGLSNQAVWAHTFSEKMGVLDKDSLLNNPIFNFDGIVMKKEIYEEFGKIKENIELHFMYEFLLRMSYNSNNIMVIPKLGYKHMNLRKGGLLSNYIDKLTPDESNWWLNLARKEYFHTNDREINYSGK